MPRRSSGSRPTPPARGVAASFATALGLRLRTLVAQGGRGLGGLVERGFERLLPGGSARRRRAEILATALFAAALLAGGIWGVPSLAGRADALSREAPPPASGPRVVFLDELGWLPASERERLAATVASTLAERSVVDREALAAAAAALESTGWFEGTPRLRRRALHRVEVEGRWRVAGALVRDGATDHLVDADGRRLPLAWPSGTGPTGLVVIEGLRESAPDRPGEIWPGGALALALRVLPHLHGRAWSGEIASIDASAVASGGPIALETARGGRLIWGRPDSGAAEVPVATRLAWLDALHAGNGSIDPPPARQFDLRLDYLASAPRRIASR